MSELSILTGDGREFIYDIEKEAVQIGRSKDNDVILSDHTASRKHARLIKTADGILLKDRGSHNGTSVNGSRITEHQSCPHRLKARSSMEAVGIDCFSMASRVGWDIFAIGQETSPEDIPYGLRLGMVLIA